MSVFLEKPLFWGGLFFFGRQETNLKSAVCAMVERLDDGVRRLEMASEQGANDPSEMEYIRQDRSPGAFLCDCFLGPWG